MKIRFTITISDATLAAYDNEGITGSTAVVRHLTGVLSDEFERARADSGDADDDEDADEEDGDDE